MCDPTDLPDAALMTLDRSERRFRIWVDGRLSERFAEGLSGVDQQQDDDGTLLGGAYVDDSHLRGVLDQLGALGIRVHRFEVDAADPPERGRTVVPSPEPSR